MDMDDGVLVALLNNRRDREIAREQHWYRIPAGKVAEHLTRANYLAFYLTKAFGDERWSIREYAPVQGHELVRRRDLFPEEEDHPRADEAYYKLQLGSTLQLPRPITSRIGRRVLFLWTSGEKFSRAVELNDLLGTSDADDALWNALKAARIGAERQMIVKDARARYRVDFWIPCLRGNVAIGLGGPPLRKLPKGRWWQSLHLNIFDAADPQAGAEKCMQTIRRAVREFGGAKYDSE